MDVRAHTEEGTTKANEREATDEMELLENDPKASLHWHASCCHSHNGSQAFKPVSQGEPHCNRATSTRLRRMNECAPRYGRIDMHDLTLGLDLFYTRTPKTTGKWIIETTSGTDALDQKFKQVSSTSLQLSLPTSSSYGDNQQHALTSILTFDNTDPLLKTLLVQNNRAKKMTTQRKGSLHGETTTRLASFAFRIAVGRAI
jgi:hypothetical protein